MTGHIRGAAAILTAPGVVFTIPGICPVAPTVGVFVEGDLDVFFLELVAIIIEIPPACTAVPTPLRIAYGRTRCRLRVYIFIIMCSPVSGSANNTGVCLSTCGAAGTGLFNRCKAIITL